jgi:hypothetical protein
MNRKIKRGGWEKSSVKGKVLAEIGKQEKEDGRGKMKEG